MKKVLGIGNALVDIMLKIPDEKLLDEFALSKGSMKLIDAYLRQKILLQVKEIESQQTSGGCASNTVHGLSHLGIETGFIGKVGNDELGAFFKNDMTNAGINPFLSTSNNNTGTAITFITKDAERTFATYLGASVELIPEELDEIIFSSYDYFHIEGYLLQNQGLIQKAVRIAKDRGMLISLDLASYNVVIDNLDFLNSLIKLYVDIVFANEEESKAFTGKNPEEAVNEIAGICDIAIVKLGEKGSLIRKGNKTYRVEAVKSNCIDTTGAGDLYAAGFLYGALNNLPLDLCGRIGSLVASNVVSVIGAKISDKTWEKIKSDIRALQ